MTPVEPKDKIDLHALSALRALGPVEAAPEAVARVRRRAHGELAAGREGDWFGGVSRAWNRVAVPAALTVMVVGYLSWAVGAASALYR
jgi:hypothetical protein